MFRYRYFLKLLCFTLFASLTTISANDFLCKDFYNNAFKTLQSNRNDSIRLSIFGTASHVSFETAQKVCRRCLDGSLVQHDDVTQLYPYLPTWIGVVSRPNATPANRDDWTWIDGTKLNQWQKNYAASISYPNSFVDGKSYAFYAFPNNWRENNNYYGNRQYEPDPSDDTDLEVVSRDGMKWIALSKEVSLDTKRHPLLADYSLTYEEKNKMHFMKYIVCERPYRPKCHFWNYTEDHCRMNGHFGCHNYINVMFHSSDDASVKCEAPEYRRVAQRCSCADCTCQVTEWGAWSSCGNEICSAGGQSKTRRRTQTDESCPPTHVHPELAESKVCTIPGCDALLLDQDSNCSQGTAASTNRPDYGMVLPTPAKYLPNADRDY